MTATKSADLHLTADQICKLHGISRRMWFNALKVRRNGCDELNAAVKDGSVTINLAFDLLAFDHPGQRLILAELPSIKPRERAGFVEIVRAVRLQEIAHGERA
jgi:hypothetical protein